MRAQPNTSTNDTVHAEFDSRSHALRELSANGGYNWTTHVQTQVGWTKLYNLDPSGLIRTLVTNSASISASAQTADNRFGGRYNLLYDILTSDAQSQVFSGFYNAQCCGLAVSYSTRPLIGVAGETSNHTLFILADARRPGQRLAVQRRHGPGSRDAALTGVPRPGPVLITGAAGFAGSHLLDLLTAGGAGGRGVASPRRDAPRASPQGVRGTWAPRERHGARSTCWDRAAVRHALSEAKPSFVYHCAGAAHVGRSWERRGHNLRSQRPRHTSPGGGAAGDLDLDARALIPGSAAVYGSSGAPLGEDHALAPASPYALSKLAQEMVGAGNPGGPEVLIARAFNHFGPRQDPWFVASGFARRIADIEAGAMGAGRFQSGNLDSRRDLTDVRDTVRAYRLINERGCAGPRLQRLLGPCDRHPRPARPAADARLAADSNQD